MAFSPDGRLVAAIGADGKARLWQVATQQETGAAVTVGPGASQGALAFSPGGKAFATVAVNGTAALWSVATQRRIGALMPAGAQGAQGVPGAQGAPGAQAAGGQATAAAAFSPDGRTLATAGASDSSSGQHPAVGRRHPAADRRADDGRPQPVYALAFSPHGTTLATAGASDNSSGSARLWDVATQQQIGAPMTAGPEPVYALAFSPDATLRHRGRRRQFRWQCPAAGRGLPGRAAGRRLRRRGPNAHPAAVGWATPDPAVPAGLPRELTRPARREGTGKARDRDGGQDVGLRGNGQALGLRAEAAPGARPGRARGTRRLQSSPPAPWRCWPRRVLGARPGRRAPRPTPPARRSIRPPPPG